MRLSRVLNQIYMYTSIIHHEIGIRSFIINQYQLTIHWLPKNNYLNSLMYKTIIQMQPLFPIYLKGKIILTMLLFSNLIRSSDSVARTLHWKGKTKHWSVCQSFCTFFIRIVLNCILRSEQHIKFFGLTSFFRLSSGKNWHAMVKNSTIFI